MPRLNTAATAALASKESNDVKRATSRSSCDLAFESLLTPVHLEDEVPLGERIMDLIVDKLDARGNWREVRVILAKDELLVCEVSKGVQKEGTLQKRDSNLFNRLGLQRTFRSRYFQLTDGVLKFWDCAHHAHTSPKQPRGVITLLDVKITVAHQEDAVGWVWFIIHKGSTASVHEFACASWQERASWLDEIMKCNDCNRVLYFIPWLEIQDKRDRFGSAIMMRDYIRKQYASSYDEVYDSSSFGRRSAEMFTEEVDQRQTPNAVSENEFLAKAGLGREAMDNFEKSYTCKTIGFMIQTVGNGNNAGRLFIFRAKTAGILDECLQHIEACSVAAKRKQKFEIRWNAFQTAAERIVTSMPVQVLVAVAIFMSFSVSVLEVQLHPKGGSDLDVVLGNIDLTMTVFFIVELLLNMAAYWFWRFWGDGWFLLDAFVVLISILELLLSALPAVKPLRVLRVFRVIRIFGKAKRFRTLINALISSLIPLLQVGAILLVFVGIFCTIGVEIFAEEAPENFGTFFRAFYTLFGVAIYGRWPEEKVPAFDEDGNVILKNVAFIYIFCLVVILVLMQVVVAVLINNFFRETAKEFADDNKCKKSEEIHLDEVLFRLVWEANGQESFDSVIQYLVRNFRNRTDLTKRIEKIFLFFDVERTGFIEYLDLFQGLCRLQREVQLFNGQTNISEPVSITYKEFLFVTDGLCCSGGGGSHRLPLEGFTTVIMQRMKLYIQRQTADAVKYHQAGTDAESSLICLKYIMMEREDEDGSTQVNADTQVSHLKNEIRELTGKNKRLEQELEFLRADTLRSALNCEATLGGVGSIQFCQGHDWKEFQDGRSFGQSTSGSSNIERVGDRAALQPARLTASLIPPPSKLITCSLGFLNEDTSICDRHRVTSTGTDVLIPAVSSLEWPRQAETKPDPVTLSFMTQHLKHFPGHEDLHQGSRPQSAFAHVHPNGHSYTAPSYAAPISHSSMPCAGPQGVYIPSYTSNTVPRGFTASSAQVSQPPRRATARRPMDFYA